MGTLRRMTDDTRAALAMITELVDEMGARFEGAFARVDQHQPLADQVELLHEEFRNLTADERAQRYLTVMALLKRDKAMWGRHGTTSLPRCSCGGDCWHFPPTSEPRRSAERLRDKRNVELDEGAYQPLRRVRFAEWGVQWL